MNLGTAKITDQGLCFFVEYLNIGSFLRGEQTFQTEASAREFCRERGLQVTS